MSKQLFQSPPFAPKDFRRKLFRNSYLCLFVTLLFATTALRAYGAELVGYWNFDEGTGLTATDLSGNNNTGVLTNGPLWTAGKFNGGLSFDGIDDYVEIDHSASLNITRELTVSAWVYNQAEYDPLLPESEYHIIAAKGWAPDPGGSWTLGWDKKTNALFFCVRRRNNNDSRCASFDFGSLAPGRDINSTSGNRIPPINWHLITGVVNNNGRIRLYIDGALAAGPVNLGTERMNSNTEPVYLGSLPSSTPGEIFTWDGYLDDVRIYNAALSDAAIASLYQVDTNIISQRNFDFTIVSSGNVATSQGSAVSTSINTVLTSGPSKFVSFSVSGLPANVTSSFSTSSCSPSCSTILTLQTNSSTPAGTYTIKVTGKAGGATKTTSFNLSISQATIPTVSPPTITPDSGIFTQSVSVNMQDTTSGASIYYTTDGSSPTQSSKPYAGTLSLTQSAVVKAKAFRSGYAPSSETSASLTVTQAFDFSLANSGDVSITAGSSVSNKLTATLSSGSSQGVSFSVSGLPSGATGSFSSSSCNPTCSSTLTISTSGSTPAGNFPITVTSAGGGLTKTTAFTLTVSTPVVSTVATPTITPNGGSFSGSVSVTMAIATSGASIYYTTDGTSPSQSSTLYTGAITLTSSAVVNAKAFKSGYNPSAEASGSFVITSVKAPPFDFSLNNSGDISVNAGSSASNTIALTLTSGSSQGVSFSISGLPSGSVGSFSSGSCSPSCSTVLNINTTASTPAGSYPITVTSTGGGVTRTTAFTLSVAVSVSSLAMTWVDLSNNEDSFQVERQTGNSGSYASIASVAADVTSYIDTGVVRGVTYCYRIAALNSAGMSPYSNEACGAVP